MDRVYNKLKELKKPLLHITEFENLESILKNGGLFSLKEINNNNINPKFMTTIESRSIDEYTDTSDYVRLAYTPLYDMIPKAIYYGELINPAVILIHPKILKEKKKILFTVKNAIANNAIYYKRSEIGDHINWKKVFSPRNKDTVNSTSHKNARQSEVMIPKHVELKYFIKIIVESGSDIDDLNEYGIEIKENSVKQIIERFNR